MKIIYVPTLITPEVIEKLNNEDRYVLLDAIDQKPHAIVGKDWLERRPNAYKILLPVSEKKPNKLYESQMKDFLGKYTREEISFGKLVELINEVTSPLSTEKKVNKDIDELFSEFRSQNPELSAAHFKEWLKLSYTISVSAIVENVKKPSDVPNCNHDYYTVDVMHEPPRCKFCNGRVGTEITWDEFRLWSKSE